MSTLHNRLRALEGRNPPATVKRIYSLIGPGTDEEAADFVRSEGWAYDDETDWLIRLVAIAPDYRDDVFHGAKPSDDPELCRLRFNIKPTNPEWRRDL